MQPILLCILLLLCSCGYRWQPEYPQAIQPIVWVSPIVGDEEGALASAIICAMHRSGLVAVGRKDGEYRLEVTREGGDAKTIGFRRDIEIIRGQPKGNLIASEARKSLVIKATLYEGNSDRIAYGPYGITAETDFDYVMGDSLQDLAFSTPTNAFVVVLPFSLGQLESNEAAQEAATCPLYEQLAQKIIDAITSEW